jgi:hypothetical protein
MREDVFRIAATGRPPGTPIALTANEQKNDVAIALLRGAVITGVVKDPNGGPIASSQVTGANRGRRWPAQARQREHSDGANDHR